MYETTEWVRRGSLIVMCRRSRFPPRGRDEREGWPRLVGPLLQPLLCTVNPPHHLHSPPLSLSFPLRMRGRGQGRTGENILLRCIEPRKMGLLADGTPFFSAGGTYF